MKCPDCEGRGVLWEHRVAFHDPWRPRCPRCNGRGRIGLVHWLWWRLGGENVWVWGER